MSTDYTNLLWGPLENARSLLASCATFQSLVGATGSAAEKLTAARAHVYAPGLDDGVLDARPFAILDQADTWTASGSPVGSYRREGSLLLALEADVPAAHQGRTAAKIEAAAKWFYSLAGDLFGELLAASGAAAADDNPTLRLTAIRLVAGPFRSGHEIEHAEGDYYQIIAHLSWSGL